MIKKLLTEKTPYVLKMNKSWNHIFPDLNSEKCQESNGFHAIVISKQKNIYKHVMTHPEKYAFAVNYLRTLNKEKLEVLLYLNVFFNNYIYNDIIFLYCPFKVGSTTLSSSIRLFAVDKINVVHLHDNEYFTFIMKRDVNFVSVLDFVYYNRSLGKNVYLIDIYRLPIERKISEFFERAARYHFNTSEKELVTYDMSRITNRLNCIFPYISNDDYYKDYFGLTYFPEKFDHEKKYILQEVNGIKYIKLRLSDVKMWHIIIKELLNLEIIMVYDYEGESKEYLGEYYKRFKAEYKLPLNLWDEIKRSESLRYYNTEEELERYVELWRNHISEECVECFTLNGFCFYTRITLENRSEGKLHVNHYIDNGCTCNSCNEQRSIVRHLVETGNHKGEKIIHAEIE
jgi:hypothetical protein